MKRDLTFDQYREALKRNGMEMEALGYVCVLRTPTRALSCYARNGGVRRRDQLAYLIREQQKALGGDDFQLTGGAK